MVPTVASAIRPSVTAPLLDGLRRSHHLQQMPHQLVTGLFGTEPSLSGLVSRLTDRFCMSEAGGRNPLPGRYLTWTMNPPPGAGATGADLRGKTHNQCGSTVRSRHSPGRSRQRQLALTCGQACGRVGGGRLRDHLPGADLRAPGLRCDAVS